MEDEATTVLSLLLLCINLYACIVYVRLGNMLTAMRWFGSRTGRPEMQLEMLVGACFVHRVCDWKSYSSFS